MRFRMKARVRQKLDTFFPRRKMKIFGKLSSCGRRKLHCLFFARIPLATHLLINNFSHAFEQDKTTRSDW